MRDQQRAARPKRSLPRRLRLASLAAAVVVQAQSRRIGAESRASRGPWTPGARVASAHCVHKRHHSAARWAHLACGRRRRRKLRVQRLRRLRRSALAAGAASATSATAAACERARGREQDTQARRDSDGARTQPKLAAHAGSGCCERLARHHRGFGSSGSPGGAAVAAWKRECRGSGVRARAAEARHALGTGRERSRHLGRHGHWLGRGHGDRRLGRRGRLGGSSSRDGLAVGCLGRRLGRRLGWRRRRRQRDGLLAPLGRLRARVYRVALVDFAGARLVEGRLLAAAARALEAGLAVAARPGEASAAARVRTRRRPREAARRGSRQTRPPSRRARDAPLTADGLEVALQTVLVVAALRL